MVQNLFAKGKTTLGNSMLDAHATDVQPGFGWDPSSTDLQVAVKLQDERRHANARAADDE